MRYQVQVPLSVPTERVWTLLADLPSWPRWTPTVESLSGAAGRPQVGTTVTIKQPGRRPARYVIDVVEDGRRFRWGSNRGGVHQAADHRVDPVTDSSCSVTLTFSMTGWLGAVLGALGAGKIRTMVDTEAASLAAAVLDPATTDSTGGETG